MKLHTLWCTLAHGKGYRARKGYIFKGGLFGAYRWVDKWEDKHGVDHGWVNHHIPSGMSTFEHSTSLKKAREGAQRLMSIIDIIDWYETDEEILAPPIQKIQKHMLRFFLGECTREEFIVKVMEDKLNGN